MIQRPPRSPRTYTLFPYTTLFRSLQQVFINLISNAIRHNDSAAPAIWVEGGTASDGMTVEIRVRDNGPRSEEHTSELQSLMRISYAVFCLKKKTYAR